MPQPLALALDNNAKNGFMTAPTILIGLKGLISSFIRLVVLLLDHVTGFPPFLISITHNERSNTGSLFL